MFDEEKGTQYQQNSHLEQVGGKMKELLTRKDISCLVHFLGGKTPTSV